MLIIIPHLLSMLLGRTIDMRAYTVGSSIYDDSKYNEVPINSMNATYYVVQGNSFPYDHFELPMDIVLKIKANYLKTSSGAMGLDGLLKDTSWMYNSVIIPVSATYRTVDRSLAKDARFLDDWKDVISPSSTHYASKFFYGAWFVAFYRFRCDIPADVTVVRKAITDVIGVSGSMDTDTISLWTKALQALEGASLKGKVKIETHVYSSVTIEDYLETPESLLKAIKDLPDIVKKGNEVGEPLFMELSPLNELDANYPEVTYNSELSDNLGKLDLMFDDVKNTRTSVVRWTHETTADFTDEEETKISTHLASLNECIRVFYNLISQFSLYKPLDLQLIGNAFDTYIAGLDQGKGTYNLAYRKLKEDLDAECDDDFHYGIKGLLKVYENEGKAMQKVDGGLKDCEKLCLKDDKCRSIGYSDLVDILDLATGLYYQHEKQCWLYYRSTSTAIVDIPPGTSGVINVYDRKCY